MVNARRKPEAVLSQNKFVRCCSDSTADLSAEVESPKSRNMVEIPVRVTTIASSPYSRGSTNLPSITTWSKSVGTRIPCAIIVISPPRAADVVREFALGMAVYSD